MNYIIMYYDDTNKKIIKEIHSSTAISLAEVHANLIAYKFNRRVLGIKTYDYKNRLLETLKESNKDKIIKLLTIFNEDKKLTLNGLEELAINDGILVYSKTCKNKVFIALKIDNYTITLDGSYNAFGLIDLTEVNINNCIIYRKEFNIEKKRAI